MNMLRARLAAALLVGGSLPAAAFAQRIPADSSAPTAAPGQVLSDAQPLPAEDRDSTGAIVIHNSRVPAQQGHPLAAGDLRNNPASIGRDPTRAMGGAPASAELQPISTQEPLKPQTTPQQ